VIGSRFRCVIGKVVTILLRVKQPSERAPATYGLVVDPGKFVFIARNIAFHVAEIHMNSLSFRADLIGEILQIIGIERFLYFVIEGPELANRRLDPHGVDIKVMRRPGCVPLSCLRCISRSGLAIFQSIICWSSPMGKEKIHLAVDFQIVDA
jgi:hypothetical protein